MNAARKLKVAAFLTAAVILGVSIGWIASRAPRNGSTAEPQETHSPATTKRSLFSPRQSQPIVETATSLDQSPVEIPTDSANQIADWEATVDQVLLAGHTENDKARTLLELFPRFPTEGQTEATGHILNLISDEDYPRFGAYLTNTVTPVEVTEELWADLLNRSDSVKLPLMLEVARNPQHPNATEARDILELYLDDDFGENWSKWQFELVAWLQKHPD